MQQLRSTSPPKNLLGKMASLDSDKGGNLRLETSHAGKSERNTVARISAKISEDSQEEMGDEPPQFDNAQY